MATLAETWGSPRDLTWADVESAITTNAGRVRATTTGGRNTGRAEHDLDSVDHAAQIETYESSVGTHLVSVCLRFSASTTTYYQFQSNTDGNSVIISKVVDDVRTELVHLDDALTWTSGMVLRGEANGSNLRLLMDGVEIATVTDSSITAGTRVGVSITTNNVARAEGDNFMAEDLGGGGAAEALAGHADAADSANATLARGRPLDSVAPAASSATASLLRGRAVAGAASAASSATGDLTVGAAPIALAGSASSASSATGSLSATVPLSGAASAAASATANLTVTGAAGEAEALAGSINAASSATASLTASVPLSGIASAASGATGDLSLAVGIIVLEGTVSSASSGTGSLTASKPLEGFITAAASASGTLDAAAAIYIFRTPTFEVAQGKGSLWGRITFDRGYSVLKLTDGTYELRTATKAEDVDAALAFYQGGREHHVTQSEKEDLEAAGFEVETV